MLNRRFLRVKVLQALYGYFSGSYDDITKGEREMLRNIDKMERLYLYLFELLLEIWDVSKKDLEQGEDKEIAKRGRFESEYPALLKIGSCKFWMPTTKLLKRREQAKIHWKAEFEVHS